ncbi:hypothetical protein J7L67_08625 [bacterium]|nr:hypothetical protein [bacterium]
MRPLSLIISLFCLVLTCAGCGKQDDQRVKNTYNSLIDKGLVLYHGGRYIKAVACFEKAMLLTPDSDKAYLYSALICDEMMNDPHKAKIYYEKFISITEDIKKKKLAENWLNDLYGRYSRHKAVQNNNVADENINPEKFFKIKEQTVELKKLNDNLKRELAAVQQELYDRNRDVSEYAGEIEKLKTRITSSSITGNYKRQVYNLKGGSVVHCPYKLSLFTDVGFYEKKETNDFLFRKYIVKSGESLMSISRKIYGDERYSRLLKETNKFQLFEGGSIHKGQILIIPKLPENKKS